MIEPIPATVLQAIEHVRQSARTSMGDQTTVATLCFVFGFPEAEAWIRGAEPAAYIQALHEVGSNVPILFDQIHIGERFRFPDGDLIYERVSPHGRIDAANAITIDQPVAAYQMKNSELVVRVTSKETLSTNRAPEHDGLGE